MREWRKTHPLSEEERQHDNCRSYTNVLIKRGHLVRGPCQLCGMAPAEGHHPDYGRPREVVWLCKAHHQQHHWRLRNAPQFVEV